MSFFTNLRADRAGHRDQVVERSDRCRRPRRPWRRLKDLGPAPSRRCSQPFRTPTRTRPSPSSTCSPRSSARRPSRSSSRAGRGQPAGHRRHRLGADQQPQLSPAPAARGSQYARHLQVGAAGGHHRPEGTLRRARAADRGLHARNPTRRPRCSASSARSPIEPRCPSCSAAAGQGPDRAGAHHQHPGALQYAGSADTRCRRSCGDPNKLIRGATLSALLQDGRPDRRRAHLRAAARSGDRRVRTGPSTSSSRRTIRTPSATWSRC